MPPPRASGIIRPAFLSAVPLDDQDAAREDWVERSAILEYEAGMSREEADREAAQMVAKRWVGRERG